MSIKRFFGTSMIYFIGSVLSKLIGFLLLPLYTSKLLPEDFGQYDLVITIISFFAPIAFFQIWDGMFRFSFDKQKVSEKYYIVTNSFSIMVLGLIIYSLIYGLVYNFFLFENAWLIFFYGIVIAIQYQYTFISRSFMKNKLFVLSGLINSLMNAMINILLLVEFNYGIESLYVASIVGSLAQVLIIEVVLHPISNIKKNELNIKLQMDMIKFSLPLCIAAVSYWMLSGYTKVVISQQLGYYANGLYAVAFKFTSMITIFITVFQYAWNEMAYLMSDDENRLIKYQKSIEYIFKVIILGSAIFLLCIKIVFPYFIDDSYKEAMLLIPLSLIGVAMNAFGNFISTIFMAEKKTKWIFWTTLVAAVVNLVFLWIMIPIWGLQGAIGALCLSFVVIALLRILVLNKMFSIKMSISNLIAVPFLAIISFVFLSVEDIFLILFFILALIILSFYTLKDIFLPILRKGRKK